MSRLTKWVDENVTHSSARKKLEDANMKAIQDQMDFYNEQKETMHKEADRISREKDIETRKIQEKQIRALRHNFRRPGFMNSQPQTPDVNSQLG